MAISYSTWMTDLGDSLANRALSEICLPGSHHSGMYSLGHRTLFASDSDSRTQYDTIAEQLRSGARVLDLRPVLWTDHTWHCGHFTADQSLGWQGATGESLTGALESIAAFAAACPGEVVILRFSGYRNCFTWDGFGPAEKAQLAHLVMRTLGNRLIMAPDGGTGIAGTALARLRAGNRALLCLFDDFEGFTAPERGLISAADLDIHAEATPSDRADEVAQGQIRHLKEQQPVAGRLLQATWCGARMSPASPSLYAQAQVLNPGLAAAIPARRDRGMPNILLADYFRPAVTDIAIRINLGSQENRLSPE